jgi:ABC-2 type transport system permease protein
MKRMHGYRELLEKEVIESWRTYRLPAACALFVLLGIGAPVITRYLPELSGGLGPADAELGLPETGIPDVLDLLLRNVILFGGLAGVLLAMGSVAGERERGTLSLVLAKPVGRAPFLLAKLVAVGLLLAAAMGLAMLAAWLYSTLLFQPTPVVPWVSMGLIAWLSTMVAASITFAGSAVASSSLGAAAIGFAALVVLGLASTISTLSPWLPTGLFDVAMAAGLEEVSPDLDPGRTILVSIAVIVASFGVAWWRFRRAEA